MRFFIPKITLIDKKYLQKMNPESIQKITKKY